MSTPENREFWEKSPEATASVKWPWWKRVGVRDPTRVPLGRPSWTLIPTPEPKGIFRTLNAEFRAYFTDPDVEPAYLTTDWHGVDFNPDAPRPFEAEEKSLEVRGPFLTLLHVTLTVHCSETGELKPFPFSFGHPERLEDRDKFYEWFRRCLRLLLMHEADETF